MPSRIDEAIASVREFGNGKIDGLAIYKAAIAFNLDPNYLAQEMSKRSAVVRKKIEYQPSHTKEDYLTRWEKDHEK